MLTLRHFLLFLTFLAFLPCQTQADDVPLVEVPFSQLSDRSLMPLGQAALSIRPSEWHHSETPNFICHFFHSFVVAPVMVEAEFYYRVIARELEKDTTHWERKSHVFVFETGADWAEFQSRGALDPWTGGIHSHGELFIRRDPQFRFKGNSLGHEIAHLVVDRFYGSNVPLWLNEGYAEDVSMRCYAAFQRARNYRMRPGAPIVPPALFIPVADLTSAVSYPQDVLKVHAFYQESERLTRFLSAANKPGFELLFDALSKGSRFETALAKSFNSRFPSMDALEKEFRIYAVKAGE